MIANQQRQYLNLFYKKIITASWVYQGDFFLNQVSTDRYISSLYVKKVASHGHR